MTYFRSSQIFKCFQDIFFVGPENKEFIEPKVQGLWKMAAAANFTVDELESLKVQNKIQKRDYLGRYFI